MTVNTDIFKRAGVDGETDERARRAVKAFRAMQPTLSAYARVLTKRKDVRVEMAARDNGSTDGRRIFYRPPIALGDKTSHNRQLCDKRDKVKQLLCPACAIREEVLVTIYHEIAHIAFDSFAKPSDADRKRAIEGAIKEAGGRWAKEIAAKIDALPPYRKDSYMGLASCINEYFPYLVNCLEDARVNRELFKARQGVRKMFDADTWKVFTKGVEQKDASGNIIVVPWNQYPLNTQVMVGTFCKASGYDYSNWFHPRVVEALNDEELTRLVGRMDTVRSAGAVYHLAFLVMARLRDLGFLGTPADPDPEKESESDTSDESQDADQSEGEGESPDSDSVPGQSGEKSSSGDEPDAGEGEGAGDSAEADGDSASGDPEEGEEDSNAGSDQESSGSGGTDGEGAGPSEDSDSDDQSSEGQEESATDSASGGQEATDGDDGRSGQGSPSSSEEGDSVDDDVSEGESSSDSIPDSDAAGDGASDDEDSGRESGYVASPSGEEDDTDSAESGEGLRGTGDINASSDGGSPEEASAEPDSGSHAGGRGSGGEADLEESMEDAGESGPAEDRSDVASTDESGDLPEGDDSHEAIDTGADDGYGGTEIRESEGKESVKSEPPMGTPDEVEPALLKWGDHEEKPKTVDAEAAEDAVDRAIVQGIYFTTPSRNIFGVREHRYNSPVVIKGYTMSNAWDHRAYLGSGFTARELGITGDFTAPESILGQALMRMRVAFSDNQRGKELRHRKTGKVDAKVLGKRAHFKDERLFKKRVLPGKRDYFVLIGMDISGSTIGKNISLEKRAVMAQATLLDRLGVNFAIYAHSGNYHDPIVRDRKFDLDIYMVKEPQEVWDSKTKQRLSELGPDSANLDGHTLEYYRKVLDGRRETDRIILYYTDGKMPAENEREELEILQREIRICKQKNYTLLGVGIRTDSPIRHGLDTVQVDDDGDVVKVVKHLEKRLLGK